MYMGPPPPHLYPHSYNYYSYSYYYYYYYYYYRHLLPGLALAARHPRICESKLNVARTNGQ